MRCDRSIYISQNPSSRATDSTAFFVTAPSFSLSHRLRSYCSSGAGAIQDFVGRSSTGRSDGLRTESLVHYFPFLSILPNPPHLVTVHPCLLVDFTQKVSVRERQPKMRVPGLLVGLTATVILLSSFPGALAQDHTGKGLLPRLRRVLSRASAEEKRPEPDHSNYGGPPPGQKDYTYPPYGYPPPPPESSSSEGKSSFDPATVILPNVGL